MELNKLQKQAYQDAKGAYQDLSDDELSRRIQECESTLDWHNEWSGGSTWGAKLYYGVTAIVGVMALGILFDAVDHLNGDEKLIVILAVCLVGILYLIERDQKKTQAEFLAYRDILLRKKGHSNSHTP